MGNALENTLILTGLASIKSITPSSGSTNGGTKVKILGNGFSKNLTRIQIGSGLCEILDLAVNELTCKTSANIAQNVPLKISISDQVVNNTVSFTFDSSLTPIISSINPSNENSVNTLLTITGSGFSANPSKIYQLLVLIHASLLSLNK